MMEIIGKRKYKLRRETRKSAWPVIGPEREREQWVEPVAKRRLLLFLVSE